MAELSQFDKIDLVLSLFRSHISIQEVGETKKTIQDKLLNEKHVNIEERLLIEILFKLEKDQYLRSVSDGHIRRNEIDYYADPKIYTLTFEGELFLLSGSYNGGLKRNKIIETINAKKQNLKSRNDYLLVVGSWLAGIGTIGLVLQGLGVSIPHLLYMILRWIFY